jgi:hypothetical protein
MADRAFEMELDRQFADAPILPDSERFAARVTATLDRGWTFRRLVIGGLGLAGGLIGAGQLLGSGLLARVNALGAQSDAMVKTNVTDVLTRAGAGQSPVTHGFADLIAAGSTMDGQVLWMSVALAVLAVGLFITRAIREI